MLNKNFVLPEKSVAVRETQKRLALLDQVRTLLDSSTEAIYIGGSLATGQNYSVHPDSDIDTALFVTPETVDNIAGTGLFEAAKATHLIEGYKRGLAQQFSLDGFIDGVHIECHFADKDTYLNGLKNREESLLRFRTSDTTPNINYGFNFLGEELETHLPTQKAGNWFVSPFPFYIRENNSFFPCRLMTNVLAAPLILKGEELLTPAINDLWSWMAEELRDFAKKHEGEGEISLIKALPGNWKFSPETKEKIKQRIESFLQ